MSGHGIELIDLTKRFGTLTAADSLNLDIADGEVLCLLGPSGCGKTTTLRMVAGLEEATSGEVRIAGRAVTNLPARERNVSMVFQFYALYPNQTVRENLAYPLHAESLSRREIEQRVARVAATLELDGLMDRPPDRLGEGEKQRVAVGRAIVRAPSCFLFDEPLSRLDVQLRETMRGQIKEVLTGLNKPTVIVTHDQLEALTMADRIAVMRYGVLEQVATPHEVFTRPANLFVAGFIGTPQMNLLPGHVDTSSSSEALFELGPQSLRLPMNESWKRLGDDAHVTVGVRPRNLELCSDPAPDTLSAHVDVLEPMGAEVLAHLLDGEHELRVVVQRGVGLQAGERVNLRVSSSQLHVFGADEKRI
ncbi:MAG: ABC transporter ATP-binding protein [Gammaproteobacteria bacterium]